MSRIKNSLGTDRLLCRQGGSMEIVGGTFLKKIILGGSFFSLACSNEGVKISSFIKWIHVDPISGLTSHFLSFLSWWGKTFTRDFSLRNTLTRYNKRSVQCSVNSKQQKKIFCKIMRKSLKNNSYQLHLRRVSLATLTFHLYK